MSLLGFRPQIRAGRAAGARQGGANVETLAGPRIASKRAMRETN